MSQITFQDLLSQETKCNPIPFFARWRALAPIGHFPEPDSSGEMWVVMSYEDSVAILSDPRFTKDLRNVRPQNGTQGPPPDCSLVAALAWRRDMLRMDPPDHTRLRGLLAKAFTPHSVEQLRPHIQKTANELLDAVAGQGEMDVIGDFAFPLPIATLCRLLGIPDAERPQFSSLAQALLVSPDAHQDEVVLLERLYQYIKELIAKKRNNPGGDLTSSLIHLAENSEAALSEIELISTIWLLIYAGYETTVNLIGNGVLALLQHPEQLRQLQQDLSLLPSAIEEILRYTSPVLLSTPRWAKEDITLHGNVIRKGELVFVSLIAADTDPRVFTDAQQFDITRQENRHLAFGRGIHFCLGAPLARLAGQIALGTLLQRLPGLRQAHDSAQLVWTDNLLTRGVASLRINF